MDQGKVLDQGEHNVLLGRNEQYASLISTFTQEKSESDGDEEADCSSDVEMLNAA